MSSDARSGSFECSRRSSVARPNPEGKRAREESRGIVVQNELRKSKKNRLASLFDEEIGKLYGREGKIFLQHDSPHES